VAAPDATRLVICGDQPGPSYPTVPSSVFGPVRWHDAASGKQLREEPLAARARLLASSPDGNRLAVATYAAEAMGEAISSPAIHLVDSQPGDKFGGHFNLVGGHAVALIWAADGKSLFTATWPKGVVLKTDASTLQPIAAVELPLKHAVFLRGGAGIITASELPEIYGWKLPSGEKQWTIKIDDKDVRGLAISPDERLLACPTTVEKGANLRLYDLSTRKLAGTFDLSPDYAERAFFSPDSSRLLVAISGGPALVYDLSRIK
jgi:WD40 repeat protein